VRLKLKEIEAFRSWPGALLTVGVAFGIQAGSLTALEAAGVRELFKNVLSISLLFVFAFPLASLVDGRAK
jgi:hypothetical protein